jgi:phosphoglycolate phosphatase-like HAD superfamily hydrolase
VKALIQTVLFDIDGVLLSEERCFDASALAVWELLHSPRYLGIDPEVFTPTMNETEMRRIRSTVFCHDEVLNRLKSQGLNSNWDMVFLTFSYQLAHVLSQLGEKTLANALQIFEHPMEEQSLRDLAELISGNARLDFAAFLRDLPSLEIKKDDIESFWMSLWQKVIRTNDLNDTKPFRSLWELGREVFQEWYVGEAFIEQSIGRKARQEGKKGFLHEEIPLAPVEDLNKLFQWLVDRGFRIGIGTGRPAVETFEPLRAMGLLQWVPSPAIVTADDVLRAEKLVPDAGALGKPHPYTYLQSYFGKEKAPRDVLGVALPMDVGEQILIIGDSVADFYAARQMGARFAAVLTGLSGRKAKTEFKQLGADFILDHVMDVLPLLSN